MRARVSPRSSRSGRRAGPGGSHSRPARSPRRAGAGPGALRALHPRAPRRIPSRLHVLALRARAPRPGVCEVSAAARATLFGTPTEIHGGLSVPNTVPAAVFAGVILLVAAMVSPVSAQPRELPAKLVTLGGTAEISRKDTPAWAPATLRANIGEGDSLRTQLGGRVTLRTASGQALRLGSRSQIALLPGDTGPEPGPTRVRLDSGWLWVAVMPGSPASEQIEVRAGPATVTVRGAGAGIRRGADGTLLVQAHHGSVVCAGPNKQWERTLTGPQQLVVPASGTPAQPAALAIDPLETTWVRWNADQDVAGGYGGAPPKP